MSIVIGFVCVLAGNEAVGCGSAPSAVICGPDPKYVKASTQITFDGSCSSDSGGSIVKYEWDLDGDANYGESGELGSTVYKSFAAGNYTVKLKVTDDDGLTDIEPCTVHAVKVVVDVAGYEDYPQWLHVGSSHPLAVGCTVTPSGLGGTYTWSKQIPLTGGTITFLPNVHDEDPTLWVNKRGVYLARVEYTVGGLTVSDNTSTIFAVEVELFRNSSYTEELYDWPADGGYPRSPAYIFGKEDPIYVAIQNYAPLSDTLELYEEAVKVTSDLDSTGIYLDVKEWPGDNDRTCYNEHAVNELLYLGEDSNDDANNNDTIEVQDEEVLKFWLEVPPGSGTYIESASVMVDRGEVGVEWQADYTSYSNTCGDLPEAPNSANGFMNSTTWTYRGWSQNFNNGDLDSAESHWGSSGDSDYADSVDLAFRYGHGETDGYSSYLKFFKDLDANSNPQAVDELYWDEIEWGDKDVDWVAIWSCDFMDGSDTSLKQMANGVHLICGYVTECLDVDCGQYFADALQNSSVKQAWFYTDDAFNPPEYIARVFGTELFENDHIYGVQYPDSIPSDAYTHWDFTAE